jgi:hypothetical protein
MITAFCVLALTVFDRAQELTAETGAKLLSVAVEKYFIENGQFPADLTKVAHYLEAGQKGLTSPWGKRYLFAVAEENGRLRPYVWTERVVGNKTRVYGVKPPDRKKG